MPLEAYVPYVFLVLCAFVFGLLVGSFLNVLVARLPYEKSIVWPSSRCFACTKPIGILDNIPILGYLRLRGKCRKCGVKFSARYLLVEVGTGLAFAALFVAEVLFDVQDAPWGSVRWLNRPGVSFPFWNPGPGLLNGVILAGVHSVLLAALIASAVIDAKHRVIPLAITYSGTLFGLIASTCLPWPWPNSLDLVPTNPVNWAIGRTHEDHLVNGLALWPAWGPTPSWAPPGSPQLGLLTSVVGAAVGMLVGRGIKTLFEVGLGKEALGLGDADLLMMSGAFLGWQPIALALPVGAVLTLLVVFPLWVITKLRRRPFDASMPFGPGLAAGVVACWFGWPWLGELVRAAFFDAIVLGVVAGIAGGGLLLFGFVFRRRG